MYFGNGCNYHTDHHGGLLTVFQASADVKKIVAEIVNAVPEFAGRMDQFSIRESEHVANARAAVHGGNRYILYSEDFLENFKQNSLTREAAYSLFAHEIGHHILEHDLGTDNDVLRREQELEADHYSGRVMARLGKSPQEALAGIQTLGNSGGSLSHPNPDARKAKIDAGYREERTRMLPSNQPSVTQSPPQSGLILGQPTPSTPINPTPNPVVTAPQSFVPPPPTGFGKYNIGLDERSFKHNRWNLIETAKAEIDDEKVRIVFRVPDSQLRFLRICILSSVESIGPGQNMTGTTYGTGSNLRLPDGKGELVWNYLLEGFSQEAVTQKDLLRVVVYDERELPHDPKFGGWAGSSLTIATGLGAFVYGLTEIQEGNSLYERYEQIRDPEDIVYTTAPIESRQQRYDNANRHYKNGQYWAIGGGLVALAGGVWLYDKFRMKETVKRDFCLLGHQLEWEPLVAANQYSEAGLRIWF